MDSLVHHTDSFTNPLNYSFPHHCLSRVLRDPKETPIVLVACGSFNPITYLHLRMFEMAKDYVCLNNNKFEIVGGYLSPVSEMYKKPGLLSATHRVNMCTLAAEESRSWIMVDSWEAFQSHQRTAVVLDHFDCESNTVLGGIQTEDGGHRDIRVMLLAGSDLISTMSEPGVWNYTDLEHILGGYGAFVVERAGSGFKKSAFGHRMSRRYVIGRMRCLYQEALTAVILTGWLKEEERACRLSGHRRVESPKRSPTQGLIVEAAQSFAACLEFELRCIQ